MLHYFFGKPKHEESAQGRVTSKPAAEHAPVKRAEQVSAAVSSKRAKLGDGGAESIAQLKCGANDDLGKAYDELLETFDEEQTKFAAALAKMERYHEEAMLSLAEARDVLGAKLEAKQGTFDASLAELEVKLTALLRKRVEALYTAQMAESSRILARLEGETRQKDVDIEALKKMYAELLERLEQQRTDHAHHVANAARDALAQQKTMAEQRLGVTKSAFQAELDELLAQLAALKQAGDETAAQREQELRELRASFATAIAVLETELASKMEAFHYEKSESHGEVHATRSQLDSELADLKREIDEARRRLAELEAAADAARLRLEQAKQHHGEVDANLAERLMARAARFSAPADALPDDDKAYMKEVARRAKEAEERERGLMLDQQKKLRSQRDALRGERKRTLEQLQLELANAEREAKLAESRRDTEINNRRHVHSHELTMANQMMENLAEQEEDSKAMEEVQDDPANEEAFDIAGDLDAQLLTLRKDASALRMAVAELQRTLRSEGVAHSARLGALNAQLKTKDGELAAARSSKAARTSDAAIAAPAPVAAAARPDALVSRSAVVEQELGAVEEELARSRGDRLGLLRERHGDLEREAAILMRLNKNKTGNGGYVEEESLATESNPDAPPPPPRAPTRLEAIKLTKQQEAGVLADIKAMEGLDAKHLNFEWDPVARLASELGDQKFVDLDYPPLETPGTYATTEVKKPHKLVYKRASSIYGNPEVFSGGIAPDDIKQGKLGDCWLMCALSACAEFPEVIRALFPGVMQTFQSSGLYRVRLCTGGLWHTVTLDDYFPCDVGAGTPIFSRANGEELWVLLLEKAMAKLSGNYFRLRGGLAAEGLMDLTGFPTFRFKFKNVLVKKMVKDGTLFDKLVFADKNKAVACASTPGEDRFTEGKGDTKIPKSGLVPGHAYSLIAAREIDGQKLVCLRNPWGKFEWDGAWGDSDPRWTAAMKEKMGKALGVPAADVIKDGDGTFWMGYEDFITHFASFSFALQQSIAGTKWHEARQRGHLALDDMSEMYSLHLTQPSHVFVGVHQHDERCLGSAGDYMDVGFTVVRRPSGRTSGDFELQTAVSPCKDRQQFAPAMTSPAAHKKWAPGEYVICVYTTGVALRAARPHPRTAWPPDFDVVHMKPVTREVFSRFNRTMDGILSVGEGGEAAELLSALGLEKISDITKLMSFARNRDGITEGEVGEWLRSHKDWPGLLLKLGYEPGKTPRDVPVPIHSRRVAISVHADEPIHLDKVTDDPAVIEEAQELPILQGTPVKYGEIEVYVAQATTGASMLAKNTSSRPYKVTMDCSKSKNCKSHTGSLVNSLVIPPGEAKIMHHVTPAGRGAWGYTYEMKWASQ
ncbi:protease-like protein [Aureococcus anophagefferens]|nr:protease-like protein [Aureococcus anophagefferens]